MKKSTFVLLLSVIIFTSVALASAEKSPYDWALIKLDYVRQEKIAQLKRFTLKIHNLAKQAAQDKNINSFFNMNQQYYTLCKSQAPPESLTENIGKMRKHFNYYSLENYSGFYDILFVNKEGSIFYTLRKESDTGININNSKVSLGMLKKVIDKKPEHEVFIDYYEYAPSTEAAAFFVEPVKREGVLVGWLVLQCPINRLNSIFSATEDLGQTGETFLVNKKGLMLTESYFKGQSTILKKRLDNKNIKMKFTQNKGHRIVTDYRGSLALSSFEVFKFLGATWLVVAKIDKDEITTNHYDKHKKYYSEMLLEHLKSIRPSLPPAVKDFTSPVAALRVDMDEFLKAKKNETLETWGVSTCTALLAMVPGEFAYLAHISPKDKIYNGRDTNLLSQLTKKIKSFDVYPFERRNVTFVALAPHLNGLENIINRLIKEGFFLSQIKVSYNKNAETVSIAYNYTKDNMLIKWTTDQANRKIIKQNLDDTYNVGEIVEKIMSMNIKKKNKAEAIIKNL